MSSWQFYERAQKEVYRKLKTRQRPQAVVGAGWGFLDHFFIFLFSLGFFARVDFRPARVKRVIVDVEELFYLLDMTPQELYRLKIKRFQRELE